MATRQTRDEREAERKAAELEIRRQREQAKLDEHNRRIARSDTAQRRPDRIVSKPRRLPPVPFDPERGRSRTAFALPWKVSISFGMPDGASERFGPSLVCDHCGHPMLSYRGRGAYYCRQAPRLSQSRYQSSGCGRLSYGPCNADESPYTEGERAGLDRVQRVGLKRERAEWDRDESRRLEQVSDDSLPIYGD